MGKLTDILTKRMEELNKVDANLDQKIDKKFEEIELQVLGGFYPELVEIATSYIEVAQIATHTIEELEATKETLEQLAASKDELINNLENELRASNCEISRLQALLSKKDKECSCASIENRTPDVAEAPNFNTIAVEPCGCGECQEQRTKKSKKKSDR